MVCFDCGYEEDRETIVISTKEELLQHFGKPTPIDDLVEKLTAPQVGLTRVEHSMQDRRLTPEQAEALRQSQQDGHKLNIEAEPLPRYEPEDT